MSSSASGGGDSQEASVGSDLPKIGEIVEYEVKTFVKVCVPDFDKYSWGKYKYEEYTYLYCLTTEGFQILYDKCEMRRYNSDAPFKWYEKYYEKDAFILNVSMDLHKKVGNNFIQVHADDIKKGDELYQLNNRKMTFFGVAHEQIEDTYYGEICDAKFNLWKTKEGNMIPPGIYTTK